MATQKTEWTLSTWANRESATYVGIDRAIDNIVIDAYGRTSKTWQYGSAIPRRPIKMEEGDVSYIMYDDDSEGSVPIIRISEI